MDKKSIIILLAYLYSLKPNKVRDFNIRYYEDALLNMR